MAVVTGAATIQVVAFSNGALPPTGVTFTINGDSVQRHGLRIQPTLRQARSRVQQHVGQPRYVRGRHQLLGIIAAESGAGGLQNSTAPLLVQNFRGNPPGGANSDYTAPDFQHVFLAAQVVNAAGTAVQTLPSFHRPALCRYWANNTNGLNLNLSLADFSSTLPSTLANKWNSLTTAQVAFLRTIMLRPIGRFNSSVTTTNLDHPNFTGSNPNFNPFWDGVTAGAGQWDVDNDGDGVPDSVWVDLGVPVRATADGHLYKPLFAILCTDLDGRLNVNAHGCPGQTVTTTPISGAASVWPSNHVFAGSVQPTDLPRRPGLFTGRNRSLVGVWDYRSEPAFDRPLPGVRHVRLARRRRRPPDEPEQVVSLRRLGTIGSTSPCRTTVAATGRRPTCRASEPSASIGAAGRCTATWDKT